MILKFPRLFLYRVIKRKWYLPEVPEITVTECFNHLNSNEPPLFIDLRSEAEFEGRGTNNYEKHGHIQNAKRISIMKLSSRFEELQEFKNKEIVTICPGGGMSLIAAEIMTKAGFKDVKSLKGGIWAWAEKGYPLIKSTDDEISMPKEVQRSEIDRKENIPMPEKYTGEVHSTLDVRNQLCPIPVLKTKKTLKTLKIGQVLEILTTDPGSQRDIPAMIHATGQELLVLEEKGSQGFRFLVKKLN